VLVERTWLVVLVVVDVVLGWSVDVVVFVVCAASGEAKSAAAIDAAKSFMISPPVLAFSIARNPRHGRLVA
jgi:hypothetical protein